MIKKVLKKNKALYNSYIFSKPLCTTKKSFPELIVEKSPSKIQPYLYLMRLDKPIGTWLLLLPGLWSISMAKASIIPDPLLFSLFSLGAVLMRGISTNYSFFRCWMHN